MADQGGILVKGDGGNFVKNPAMQIVRDTAHTIRSYAQEFGLTPSARVGPRACGPPPESPHVAESVDSEMIGDGDNIPDKTGNASPREPIRVAIAGTIV